MSCLRGHPQREACSHTVLQREASVIGHGEVLNWKTIGKKRIGGELPSLGTGRKQGDGTLISVE